MSIKTILQKFISTIIKPFQKSNQNIGTAPIIIYQEPVQSKVQSTYYKDTTNILKNRLFYQSYQDIFKNPDPVLDLATERNISVTYTPQVYEMMEREDTHISNCINALKQTVIGTDFDILIDSEEEADLEILNFIKRQLYEKIPLEQKMYAILDALPKGYSVSEIILEMAESGRAELKDLRFVPAWAWVFDTDKNPRYLTTKNPYKGELMPPEKFVIFSYNDTSNPYGKSILGARNFWFYYLKRANLEYWSRYIEKFGVPTIKGTADKEMPIEVFNAQLERFMKVLEGVHSDTNVAFPPMFDAQIMATTGEGNTIFEKFWEVANKEISKDLIGGTLLTETSSQTGTYSQGSVHLQMFYNKIEYICRQLASVINFQLINRLVDINFGVRDYYPYIKFDTRMYENLTAKIEVVEKLHNIGLPISKSYIYEEFNVMPPDIQKDDDVLQKIEIQKPTLPFSQSEKELIELYNHIQCGEKIESTDKKGNYLLGL